MKIPVTLLLVFGFAITACGRKEPPDAVKKVFQQKFDGAESVKWLNEKAAGWEAEFKIYGKEMTASFNNAGNWLETKIEVPAKSLTAEITSTLNKEFAGYELGEISVVQSPVMEGFEVSLKNKGKNLTVVFSSDGTVIKKEDSGY